MYHILDEPRPGKWEQWAVDPVWPLLGLMFGGSWLAFPWFIFNALALGCPAKRKIIILALSGFGGSLLLALLIKYCAYSQFLTGKAVPYTPVIIILWKLGVSYHLYLLQSSTFQIFEHFGSRAKNGLPVLAVGILGRMGMLSLFNHPLWKTVIG